MKYWIWIRPFRLGDEAELKLLKSDVARGCDGDLLCIRNRAFRAFVDRYANGKTDQGRRNDHCAAMIIQEDFRGRNIG
ncbi:MAG: hypothetical protein ACLR1V_06730 [Coprococcus sp.]